MTMSKAPKEEEVWRPEEVVSDESNIKEHIVPYGNTQDQLVAGLHYPENVLKNNVGTFDITATGSLSITGVGFKPSSVRIVATKNWVTYALYSDWTSDGTNTVTYRQGRNSWGFIQYIVTDNIVSVSDYSGSFLETFSSIVSFDKDWFTLNTSSVSWTVNCSYIALW